MRTVFRREFLLAFRRLYAYIVIGVSVLIGAIMFITGNLTYTTVTTASSTTFMQLVSAMVIPVIAMGAFVSGKKSGTDAFYEMLPLKSSQIYFGKYLSALAVFMISVVPMLLYPMIAGAFGSIDHAQSYSLILIYVLSEAAFIAFCSVVCICLSRYGRALSLAICYISGVSMLFMGIANVVISVKPWVSLVMFAILAAILAGIVYLLTRKVWISAVALVLAEATVFAVYFISPELYVCGFENFLESIALFGRYDVFISGIFDAGALIFYAVAIALFLFLGYRSLARRRVSPKKLHYARGKLSALLAIVLVGATILSSAAVFALPRRALMVDMTVTERNTVGIKAQKYLATVDKPVTIYLLEATGAIDYELYLENIAACNSNITLEKVYYANTPEFYTERGITLDYAGSLYIESENRGGYLSYVNLFTYTNATLGLTDMNISDYQYYYNMFSSNAAYVEYLNVLLSTTTENFNADREICSLIEYTVKDIIPTSYYLTGHGEKPLGDENSAFAGYGFVETTLEGGVPADAASIMINAPTSDISTAERDALLEFLSRGGEITFITSASNLDMPNLCSILSEYGLSASKDIVTVAKPAEDKGDAEEGSGSGDTTTSEGADTGNGDGTDEEPERTAEFTPTINTDSDFLYMFESAGVSFSVKDTNAISFNAEAADSLILTPLLTVKDGETSYTIAASAETSDGARIAWFTGAESFNDKKSYASFCPLFASNWTTIEYESDTDGIPSKLYSPLSAAVTSSSAVFVAVVLILIPLAFIGVGCVFYALRRRAIKKRA